MAVYNILENVDNANNIREDYNLSKQLSHPINIKDQTRNLVINLNQRNTILKHLFDIDLNSKYESNFSWMIRMIIASICTIVATK